MKGCPVNGRSKSSANTWNEGLRVLRPLPLVGEGWGEGGFLF